MFLVFSEVVSLGEEAHLNTSFKHFIYFVQEFDLIDRKELAPLQELIERLTCQGGSGGGAMSAAASAGSSAAGAATGAKPLPSV